MKYRYIKLMGVFAMICMAGNLRAQVVIDGLTWKPNLSNSKDVEESIDAPGITKKTMYDRIYAFSAERIKQTSAAQTKAGEESSESADGLVWEAMPSYWSKPGKIVAFSVTTEGELNVTIRHSGEYGKTTKSGLLTYHFEVACADNKYTLTTHLEVDTEFIPNDPDRARGGYLSRYFLFDYRDADGKVYPDHQRLHERIGREYKEIKAVILKAITG